MLPSFPKLEEDILAKWKKQDIFKKSLAQTKQGKRFVFFEGPPTANGSPHIGHVLARAFKDIICRFKTMRGYFVERKGGWDTQGLPVELEVEKQIGVSGKKDIEKYGIEKFNQACRASVWKYKAEWEKMTERIGYWLDLERPFITYEKPYIETLWWIFKQLWDKKLLVKDYKVVPQCPRCETALSSHEVAQGYEKVTENSVYVKFKVTSDKGQIKKGDYILSWTTTPWTLPGNVGLAVSKDTEYIEIEIGEERFVLADETRKLINLPLSKKIESGRPMESGINIINRVKGQDLVGIEYEPLFPGAIPESVKGFENAFKVYAADFVTTDEGTGVVHTAVMYGEDDYQLGAKVSLPKHHTVTPDGHFTKDVKEFAGQYVKDKKTEQAIIDSLKQRGLLYMEELYEHDYPKCWRCHSPLLYYAKDSWFIKMSALREQLIKNNEQINWVPEYIKQGRFGEWLNEIKDWAISRERYWGTPIPIWECKKCGERECIGSYQELNKRSGKKEVLDESFDPHRPFIDDIIIPCKCGGEMKRISEVADTWFDSGAMPFAQWHYPFENKERVDKGVSFPADYIAEAIDQTRGWFYTLLAISTALGNNFPPYKNVVCLGHILDADGRKMSKHLGNVVKPNDAINEFGIDAVRWYFFTVNQPGEYKRFDPMALRETVKKNFLVLWNVLSFYKLYQTEPSVPALPKAKNVLDRWVLARLRQTGESVTDCLNKYQIAEAGRTLADFIAELSTWYVRRSRERFKLGEKSEQAEARNTLGYVLMTLTEYLAPFTPFLADAVYQEVGGAKDSVHLEPWPDLKDLPEEKELLAEMDMTRRIAELVHAARASRGIKVRQPLSQLVVRTKAFRTELVDILKAEVNVHDIFFRNELLKSAEWEVKEAAGVAVSLDTTITDELYYQGFIREVIRQVNSLRKEAGLTIKDSIEFYFYSAEAKYQLAMEQHLAWVKQETISRSVSYGKIPETSLVQKEFKEGKTVIALGLKKLD
ncbi:MAG: isoleucine--tRNA ligase [Patescibacteria group bacterium]|nr:isoleucine--tRNA ligase [Patescibacteria group bacterium]